MHKLLRRQLRRHLDVDSIDGVPSSVRPLIAAVDEAYHQADVDRELLERSLELTSEELMERNADLARSNADLEQYAYVVSHDLREPLTSVQGYIQLLQRRYGERLEGEAAEFMEGAISSIARLQELIVDLLDFSRVGRGGPRWEAIPMGTLVDAIARRLRVPIERNEAQIVHANLPEVVADRQQLSQLLQNLIANAIKFRRDEPPRVHVSGETGSGVWKFAIRDNGIGISPQYTERVFQLFQRLHTRDSYPGTGIGLAICSKIVRHHGGDIWVESTPGEGSTFYFTLPIRHMPKQSEATGG